MYGLAQRILGFLPRQIRFLLIGFIIYYVLRFILSAGWAVMLGTPILWAVVLLSIAREAGRLEIPASSPLTGVLNWLTVGKADFASDSHLPHPNARPGPRAKEEQRQRLATMVEAFAVQKILDEGLLGQRRLNEEVAREIEAFVKKRSPERPLSFAIAGPPASGRTSFCETLASATAFGGPSPLIRVDCASDSEADLSQIASTAGRMPLPVLALDNFDRLGGGRHGSAYVGSLARLIEKGIVAGRPVLAHAIIVLTVPVGAPQAIEAWQRCERFPEERDSIMRQAIGETGHIPQNILYQLDFVSMLAPLDQTAQVAVVWKVFCAKAEKEHGLTILGDNFVDDPGLVDFLIGAQISWQKTGDWGVYEAARVIDKEARDALSDASRRGYRTVRARWDKRARRLKLDPVAFPVTAA